MWHKTSGWLSDLCINMYNIRGGSIPLLVNTSDTKYEANLPAETDTNTDCYAVFFTAYSGTC